LLHFLVTSSKSLLQFNHLDHI